MKGPSDEELEDRLEAWAGSHASRPEQLVPLADRIRSDWAALAEVVPPHVAEINQPKPGRTVAAWAVAIAAVVLVALGLRGGSDPSPAELPWAEHTRQQAELLRRCHELFGDQLSWMVESGDRSDLGLASNASPVKSYVAVRLRLTARSADSQPWRVVQTLNVIAAGETTVEFPASEGDSTQLSLWAYPLDQRVISIDLRYHPSDLPETLIEASVAQVSREPQTISGFEKDGVEYRLHQTAELIPIGKTQDRPS